MNVGILLITHEPLASAFVAAATHVFGAAPAQLVALDVKADEAPEVTRAHAQSALAQLDTGAGVLVLVDIQGATPCNCAQTLSLVGKVEVVVGISLPMLLRALAYRHLPLHEVALKAVSGGQAGAQMLDASNAG